MGFYYLGKSVLSNQIFGPMATFEGFTEQLRKAAEHTPQLDKTLKIQLDEGVVFVDLTQQPAAVSHEDKEADTTIITSLETLEKMRAGELNPMMATMSGKVKIKGDMGLALKLQNLLS